ncbi:MAG: family 43 glycosylhydrolase [Odoribacter splanchnicus]
MVGYGCRTTSFASGRPLFLLTAKQSEKDKIAGYESGADGYLIKPFGLSLLHARIKSLLKNRERITRDFYPRHGTIIPVTVAEAERLERYWGNARRRTVCRETDPEAGNPVIRDFHADPAILFARQTGKFYLYPTTDGYEGWGGNSFKAFSSPDLVHWQDEGIVLDLPSQVKWADRNAWDPSIIEEKIGGKCKYFYYYTAASESGRWLWRLSCRAFQGFGKTFGRPFASGVNGERNIDPDVFTDPVSGKSYLYWGNGFMAVAELSGDRLNIVPGSQRVITPSDGTFREGTCVIFRKGKYYFLWSEDDTRSENYRVRYGIADSPVGPIQIPESNLILAKDPEKGIYGTGHNSVIQIPGKDEWYIVYHRFKRLEGITMGGCRILPRSVHRPDVFR